MSNVRAVISLPQGVFVSKSGQGAKTSILYFEKGQPTDFVWYYKIENDGFSMGTNRKPIDGSQIPQLLEIFKEIKQGKKPKDTKHSFCIPREWIETLDPRVTERIKKEVKERFTQKNKAKREKLLAGLDEKLAKGKLSKAMYDEKLWQFDNVVESQIDNEVAKAIEKANAYHFNLQNYCSNLSKEQIKEWQSVCHSFAICHSERSEGSQGSSIEKRYYELKTADPQTALQILASFDPQNALQIDIAREYLGKLDKQVLEKDEKLMKLETILKKGFHYPMVSLKELIVVNDEKIKPAEYPEQKYTVLGVSNKNGVFINEILRGEDIKQVYFKVHKNQFCYNPYRINVGSIGLCKFDLENQIISGAYNIFGCKENELSPEYLEALLKTKRFLDYVNEKASGGVRMDFKIEYLHEWQIPLPPLEIQNEIVEKIEKQKQIIEGAEKILDSWEPEIEESQVKKPLKDFIVDSLYGISSPLNDVGKYPVLRMNNLDTKGNWSLDDLKYIDEEIKEERKLKIGDFLFNRTNSIDLVGKSGVINFDFSGTWAGYLIRVRFNDQLSPYYLKYLFAKNKYKKYFSSIAKPAGGQANINAEELAHTIIDYYPIETQFQIVEKLDRQMQALDGVRLLKSEAQKRIDEILKRLWGE
ncbi:MAG: hypothetical protein DYG84_03150 [Candidatus Brocadia sp. AMX3]|nr:hypothetical protein [Candidatus Brocadia sp. AMX3]